MQIDYVSIGTPLFAFASHRGFDFFPAQHLRQRPANHLWRRRRDDSVLEPKWMIIEIDGVSIGVRLFAFPPPGGSLSPVLENVSHA